MVSQKKPGSMASEKMISMMNQQIKNELDSAYLYLSMAVDLFSKGWEGMAHWMKKQAQEEQEHAMKFYHHLEERGLPIRLLGIDEPKHSWNNPLEIFSEAYDHEVLVSNLINDLYAQAVQDKDYPAQVMLQWFVSEQVEEEGQTLRIKEQLEKIGDSTQGLFMLDHELGKRKDD